PAIMYRAFRRNPSALRRGLFTQASPQPPPSPLAPLKTALVGTAVVLSTGLLAVYYFDARSAVHRYVLTPALRNLLDAETGHRLAVSVLKSGLAPRDPLSDDTLLKAEMWGTEVSNPVGLAAGFDKHGEAIDGLFNLGFSWVEIGSVTPKPQPGNPQPRVFHLPEDEGLINRYGFPSDGHASVISRLRARIPRFSPESDNAAYRPESLLAVNLGKNKESEVDSIEDFVAGVRAFGPYSDVLVVNVSSPNTPGLRGLQNREQLESLLDGVTKARAELAGGRKPKLMLKIAPDLTESQLVEMAGVIAGTDVDGVIVSNTTIQRPVHLLSENKTEMGGLSGTPLKPLSIAALKTLRSHLPASIPLIGCGGISSGQDALEYARAGAALVQVYTGFGYDGVGACRRIKDELADELRKEGKSWREVVDLAVAERSLKPALEEKTVEAVAPAKEADSSQLSQLIAEAEELRHLVDQYAEAREA
ncbi:unnamed protein product, partial [Mycena citricolor]